LAAFRAAHPPRELVAEGVAWRYLKGGEGRPVVLALTGALGRAELGFLIHQVLERELTVIAPDYPPVTTAAAMIGGLLAILDREGVDRAVVHGASYGGLVAQRLGQTAPSRVAALVLSHTGPVEQARVPPPVIRVLRWLPEAWVLAAFRRKLGGLVGRVDPFWRTWVERTLSDLGKEELLARLELAGSLASSPAVASGSEWRGPTLLLEGSDDPAVPPAARAELRARFPEAELHRFEGTGHSAAVLDPEGYAAVLRDFVVRVAA
jgi:pimeloyl-ACP methyl ester carboxylesterase